MLFVQRRPSMQHRVGGGELALAAVNVGARCPNPSAVAGLGALATVTHVGLQLHVSPRNTEVTHLTIAGAAARRNISPTHHPDVMSRNLAR
jgi:hypothetical protein